MPSGHANTLNPEPPPNVQSKLLSSISPADAHTILAAAQPRRLTSNQPITVAGSPATHLFLLRGGRVKLFRSTSAGEEVLLAWLVAGDVFGIGTLLRDSGRYLASADAVEGCEVLVWEHPILRSLAKSYPQLAENAVRIVLDYLRSYIERHVAFSTQSAAERLARLLLDLSHRTGVVSPYGVEIAATNDQLGALGDMTPFTASRLLAKWERDGTISRKRGKILVHAPEELPVD